MEDSLIDRSQILLQENIPLTDEEIKHTEERQEKANKIIVIVLAVSTLFIMGLAYLSVKDSFAGFKYYDYILFVCGGFALFGLCYFIVWLLKKWDNYNWKKDKAAGKNKLTSIIIGRDKTEDGEYLTFAGKLKQDKIRLRVKPADYQLYRIGTKVLVTYLKFSREALELIQL